MNKKIAKSISDIDFPTEEKEDNFFTLPWKQASRDPSLIKRGTEIHLSPIPSDSTASFLYEALKGSGNIIDIRIHSNENKSFAFVRFDDQSAANSLKEQRWIMLKSTKAYIHMSKEQLTLFVGNINKKWTEKYFTKIINQKVPFISSIRFIKDPMRPECNRGYCFLEFDNPLYAKRAYEALSDDILIDGVAVTVDWAKGLDSSSDVSKTQLYLSGIKDENTTEQLYEALKAYGKIVQLKLSRDIDGSKRNDFGFVSYSTPGEALEAYEHFNWRDHFENEITMQFAKKISSLITHRKQVEGNLLERKRMRDNVREESIEKPKPEPKQESPKQSTTKHSISPPQTEHVINDFLRNYHRNLYSNQKPNK